MSREVDIAWAAGLFEGEGCFSVGENRPGKYQPQASLSSVDRDVIDKFHEIIGMGKIRTRLPRVDNLGKQTQFTWQVQSRAEFLEVGDILWEHLGIRRQDKFIEIVGLLDAQVDGRRKENKQPVA